MDEDSTVDLKALRSKIGARGNLSFGTPEMLLELLGVTPGSVSLLGLINDKDNRVTAVIERRLLDADFVNCHPLTNERTTSLTPADVMSFLALTGHMPLRVTLEESAEQKAAGQALILSECSPTPRHLTIGFALVSARQPTAASA